MSIQKLRDIIGAMEAGTETGPAAELLYELREAGFVVVTDEESLWVLPRKKLTPRQVERIREHRDALVRLTWYDTPQALIEAREKIRRLESELNSARRIGEMRDQQIAMLNAAMGMLSSSGPIPDDMWRTLAGLVHPDRHNGSQAATRAMAWLNSQRRMDS